jgi:hypothetical protein
MSSSNNAHHMSVKKQSKSYIERIFSKVIDKQMTYSTLGDLVVSVVSECLLNTLSPSVSHSDVAANLVKGACSKFVIL